MDLQKFTGSKKFTFIKQADYKLTIFFLFFPENRLWHSMQIVFSGDNLHEMSKLIFWEKKKKKILSICHLPSIVKVNT